MIIKFQYYLNLILDLNLLTSTWTDDFTIATDRDNRIEEYFFQNNTLELLSMKEDVH